MGADLDKQLLRAGFRVNSYQEVSSFVNGKLEQSIKKILLPKDYVFEGYIWTEIRLSSHYEREFFLMRQPEIDFQELWELYISTSNNEDELGAILLIFDKYCKELLDELNQIVNKKEELDKKKRRKLRKLRNLIDNAKGSIYEKQLLNIIQKTKNL